jgi:hypothetical protein
MSLFMDPRGADKYLRVGMSLFQYQLDPEGQDWIFRYEYGRQRVAGEIKPACHLHVRGDLRTGNVLRNKDLLEHVHFPCGRPTVESTIRLLIDDFGVPSDAPDHVWRPILRQSEEGFMGVAHKCQVPVPVFHLSSGTPVTVRQVSKVFSISS